MKFQLIYYLVPNIDTSSTNSSTVHNRSSSIDAVDAPATLRSVGIFKRNLHRITSICSNRARPTDQEKAILIVLFFMLITAAFAAFLQTCLR